MFGALEAIVFVPLGKHIGVGTGLCDEPISGLPLMRSPAGAINIGLWAAC
jgi:hypothetical protein